MRRRLVLPLLVLFGVACDGEEESFEMVGEPSTALALSDSFQPTLGMGVDAAETKAFRECVTTPVKSSPTRDVLAAHLYRETQVRDRNELNSELGVSASLSAKGLWGNAGGSASYFKSLQMSREAFYWLVDAKYDLHDTTVDTASPQFKLTDAALAVLNGPRGVEAFHEMCGDYFLSGQRKGARYTLLYEFKSQESKAVERIKAAAEYEGFGVKAKAEFAKLTDMAQKASILHIYAASEGAGSLEPYAKDPEKIETELSRLRGNLLRDGGVVTQWYRKGYEVFPEYLAAKQGHTRILYEPNAYKDVALETLYRNHLDASESRARIQDQLEKARGNAKRKVLPSLMFSAEKTENLRQDLAALNRHMRNLALQAGRCINGGPAECNVDELVAQLPTPPLVTPDKDWSTLNGWELHFEMTEDEWEYVVFAVNPTTGERFEFLTEHKFVPGEAIIARTRVFPPPNAGPAIGSEEMIRDPHHGQLRANVCLYNFEGVCSISIIDQPVMKLRFTILDKMGIPLEVTEFPAREGVHIR